MENEKENIKKSINDKKLNDAKKNLEETSNSVKKENEILEEDLYYLSEEETLLLKIKPKQF